MWVILVRPHLVLVCFLFLTLFKWLYTLHCSNSKGKRNFKSRKLKCESWLCILLVKLPVALSVSLNLAGPQFLYESGFLCYAHFTKLLWGSNEIINVKISYKTLKTDVFTSMLYKYIGCIITIIYIKIECHIYVCSVLFASTAIWKNSY